MIAFAFGAVVGITGTLLGLLALGYRAERQALLTWRNGGPPNPTVADLMGRRPR